MSKQVQELVSSLHEHVGDKVVVLCTGYNTKPECAEHLASAMDTRNVAYEWVYWNGSGAHSEPPIFVPMDMDKSLLCQLATKMYECVVDGIGDIDGIATTDNILEYDNYCSTDCVSLIWVSESYEEFLD